MYENIDYILDNYFGPIAEYSEQKAISVLRKHLANSVELAEGLRTDLQSAMTEKTYSWKNAFVEHDVLFIETEEEARSYAKKILWDALFAA